MQLKYDLDVNALYIKLSDEPVERTRELDENTNVDVDAAGGLVGIEVVSLRHPWPLSRILAEYQIPPSEEAQLRAYFYLPETARAPIPSPPVVAPPRVSVQATPPVRALVPA